MWNYFNTKFEKAEEKIDSLKIEINNVEKRLAEKLAKKIDALRNGVSRIEGHLVPAQIVSFEKPRLKQLLVLYIAKPQTPINLGLSKFFVLK